MVRDVPRPEDLAGDRARALALTPVSRETLARLDVFVALLLQRQRVTNLVAPSTLPTLWTRHVADSLQLVALAQTAKIWVDLGTGGGFPGLVLACSVADANGTVHLVESVAKKAAFLRDVAAAADVPAIIHHQRVEDFAAAFKDPVDVVTARALAPMPRLLGYVKPLMQPGTQALLMKGQDVEAELTEASKYWRIEADLVPSLTDPLGRIVRVRSLEPRR